MRTRIGLLFMMESQAVKSSPGKESGHEMADLGAIVAQLKAERAKLDKAIEVLSGVAGKSGGGATRKLSAAARAGVAAAQRARWAKYKAKKKRS